VPGEDNLDVTVFLSQIFDPFDCLLKEELRCLFEPSMNFALCAIWNVVVDEARFEIFLPILRKAVPLKTTTTLFWVVE
jgi:CBS-domain-containing membrane protein